MAGVHTCIHRVPIFRSLPDASVMRLGSAMHHRHLQAGESVVMMGEPVTSLIVVSSGLLRLSRSSRSGREQVLRELGPGQFFGEMALFTEVMAEGDLVAATETHACVLEKSAVQEVLKTQPDLAVGLVQEIAQRLSEAERTIGDLALLDVGERLAVELLRLAEEAEGGPEVKSFELPVTWAQMATKLGTTPESLSRRLKRLTKEGLVQVDGRRVVVPDLQALREAAEV